MHQHQPRSPRRTPRRGSVVVVMAFFLMVFVGFIAFAIDIGYLVSSKAELQRTADATAMAACWEYAEQLSQGANHADAALAADSAITASTSPNVVCGSSPVTGADDVSWGYLADLTDRYSPLDASDTAVVNAVEITIQKTSQRNGMIPVFFAKALGFDGFISESKATAAILRNVAGFKTPSDDSNLDILPFALDVESWNSLLASQTTDDWTWNKTTKSIQCGSDGVYEVNLYPQGTGSPGNRGTVDIGSSNNSTNDIARQITDGISSDDMDYHNGELKFDENGELALNGDTGISAGVKDELASIKGEPRIIPIFQRVEGPGNNAEYTIVQWAGVRIMDVKLTGPMKKKRVIVQPAPIVVRGTIPGGTEGSDYIYSPVVLVR